MRSWVSAFVLVMGLVVVAGYVGWWYLEQTRPEGASGADVAFTVTETDTIDSLTTRLAAEGFIVDESVFKWYVERKGGLELTPGFYQLHNAGGCGNDFGEGCKVEYRIDGHGLTVGYQRTLAESLAI